MAARLTSPPACPAALPPSAEWRRRYGDEVSFFKWCREGLPEEVPQLQQVLKLESRKPRPAHAVTVVTQLSLERFQMLENQCTTWPHQVGGGSGSRMAGGPLYAFVCLCLLLGCCPLQLLEATVCLNAVYQHTAAKPRRGLRPCSPSCCCLAACALHLS